MKKTLAMIALAAICFGTTASALTKVKAATDTTKVKVKKKPNKMKMKKKKVTDTTAKPPQK
ncbi:MAG: hypothetical protein JST32_04235 [Bacteroidetes bacterium]|nr:hypothetical protein [Bacteroidota bacterium]